MTVPSFSVSIIILMPGEGEKKTDKDFKENINYSISMKETTELMIQKLIEAFKDDKLLRSTKW